MFDLSKKLVFLHHSKTAGTAIDGMMRRNFSGDEICSERSGDLTQWPQSVLERKRYFSFHGTMEDVACIPGDKYLVTFFREPHTRLVSQIDFNLSFSEEAIEASNLRIARFIRLEGVLAYLRSTHPVMRRSIWNPYTVSLVGGMDWDNEDQLTELAMKALDRFDFIGLTEHMDTFAGKLAAQLDIPERIEVVNETNMNWMSGSNFVNAEPIIVTDEIADAIRENIRIDLLLYEEVMRRCLPEASRRELEITKLHRQVGRELEGNRLDKVLCYDETGFILFGPGMRIRPGRYRADFFVEPIDNTDQSDAPWLRFDVSHSKGDIVLASLEVDQGFRETSVSLPFHAKVPISALEFRVRKLGCKPVVVSKRIRLQMIEAH